MTQEEKNLLIKDLCGRLPYGVTLNCCDSIGEKLVSIEENGLINHDYDVDEVKPYLFPLSSMTEEQINMIPRKNQTNLRFTKTIKQGDISSITADFNLFEIQDIFDWFNKNHFDYRGLIDKSLALDATNLGIYE